MNNNLVDLLESDEGREAIENMTTPWGTYKTARKLMRKLGPTLRAMMDEGWEAARKTRPDLIACHPKGMSGVHYAEKLGVPVVLAFPFPQFVATGEFPSIGFPEWKLGRWYNRMSYMIVNRVATLFGSKYIKEWRSAHDLPPRPRGSDSLHTGGGKPIPIMHGYSSHVSPRPADWPDTAVVTGYWFLERGGSWQPAPELERFLEEGDPPVYVGFGSMSGRKPRRIAEIVLGALRRAERRGILATGLGGLKVDDLPDDVFKIESVPHDWLFPRVSAVVHHGGAGTTAAGLRAGRPTIICPFFGDQPFWGRRVRDLGAACAPIPQRKLTVERLGDAIVEVTTNPAIGRSAEAVGKKIRAEDGIGNAVAFMSRLAQ